MMNSIVPSIISSTNDITEIVRLARLLWPDYLSPLDKMHGSSNSSAEKLVWQILGCMRQDIGVSSEDRQHHASVECCSFCQHLRSDLASETSDLQLNVLEQQLSEELDRSIRERMRSLLSSTVMMPGRVLSMENSSPYAGRLPYITKFVLLAAFCFSRASTRCERWLVEHPRFGPMVRDWRANHAMPLRAKQLAWAMMAAGSLWAAWVLPARWAWLPALCCAAVALWMWRLPTAVPARAAQQP